ncbi:MAG TPA: M20/M25/M40 family metallo-hydrolase [Vicinamibacterales bacterium]|jgi:acetylornithine deacetylase|nr:M20/M25/M40 family metallo-hydrolase [Vicinamibacterales bacterium]
MIDPVGLTRRLVDIDSTTGREGEVAAWLAGLLRNDGYQVTEQPVTAGRFNLYAHLGTPPQIVLSTHFDCVPPFFPSRVERGLVFGRGACDAKGIIAAQIAAAELLRASGETRFALLFLAGEERGSDGARVANEHAPAGIHYLINGEPTDNRLGAATRGVLRVRLHAAGRAAHSAFPELGDSAIDKLLDALMVIRGIALPDDPILGRTHYTVGLIEGGVAPNVVSPHASAELLFRTVGDGARVLELLKVVETLVTVEQVLDIAAVRMHTLPGFESAVFPFTTDVPVLTRWGTPMLIGPGSIHVAHTDEEHVSIDELLQAVKLYRSLAERLLAETEEFADS